MDILLDTPTMPGLAHEENKQIKPKTGNNIKTNQTIQKSSISNKIPNKAANIKKIKKLIGKKYLTLLESNKISIWQISLRKHIHIDDLKICFPNLDSNAPKGAPKWAGGEDLKFSKKEVKNWTKGEIQSLIESCLKTQTLFAWEASLLHCQNAKRIIKIILSNNIKPKMIEASPTWIAHWAQYNQGGTQRKKNVSKTSNVPKKLIATDTDKTQPEFDFRQSSEINTLNDLKLFSPSQKIIKHKIKKSKWTKKEKENLGHYWKLELLGSDEIAALMERCPNKTILTAKTLGLPKKPRLSSEDWCGIKWQFTPEGEGDPRHLNPNLQRLVAEASATRFSLLYEMVQTIKETDSKYRKIQKELNQILELHSRIFSKYLLTRSRKYKFLGTSAWQVQKDLEQAGQTAIFECLRRWHPNRNIRFSRGTVNIAINREMLAWLEQQRLVELPDKIRSVARKLKQAHDRGNWDKEVDRLKKEAGENCVREASKHQNTYAYLHTVPLMESYDETEAEHGGVTAGTAECIENFSAVCMPQSDTDVCSLLIEACSQIPCAERRAVLAYHGINEDGTHGPQQTLEEIGAREGVTKERIRQRILKAKQRMRRWLERKNIKNVHDALSHA
jgi:RNA polymerase primary sigma factor